MSFLLNFYAFFPISHRLSVVELRPSSSHRLCEIEPFLPRWLRTGWQSLISQGKIPWNAPPWLGIEPGPQGGRTVSYPTELSLCIMQQFISQQWNFKAKIIDSVAELSVGFIATITVLEVPRIALVQGPPNLFRMGSTFKKRLITGTTHGPCLIGISCCWALCALVWSLAKLIQLLSDLHHLAPLWSGSQIVQCLAIFSNTAGDTWS